MLCVLLSSGQLAPRLRALLFTLTKGRAEYRKTFLFLFQSSPARGLLRIIRRPSSVLRLRGSAAREFSWETSRLGALSTVLTTEARRQPSPSTCVRWCYNKETAPLPVPVVQPRLAEPSWDSKKALVSPRPRRSIHRYLGSSWARAAARPTDRIAGENRKTYEKTCTREPLTPSVRRYCESKVWEKWFVVFAAFGNPWLQSSISAAPARPVYSPRPEIRGGVLE
ncbi:hypothetical protein VUR80DRAFT_8685 [Thermomyces stellatus]